MGLRAFWKVYLPFHWSLCVCLIVPLGAFIGCWLRSPALVQEFAVLFIFCYTAYVFGICAAAARYVGHAEDLLRADVAVKQQDAARLVNEGRRRLVHLLNAVTTLRKVAFELVRLGGRPDLQNALQDLMENLRAVQRDLRPRMVPAREFDGVLGASQYQNRLYQIRVAELARCRERLTTSIRGLYEAHRILRPPPETDLDLFFSFSPEARAAHDVVGWALLGIPSVAAEMSRRYGCPVEELPERLRIRRTASERQPSDLVVEPAVPAGSAVPSSEILAEDGVSG